MIALTPELAAFKASRRYCFRADLYTFTLVGGAELRYTNASIDLAWAGQTFSRCNISREDLHFPIGCQVNSMAMTIRPAADALILGRPWLTAVDLGALDDAEVLLQQAFLSSWIQPVVGVETLFSGRVGPVKVDLLGAELTVNSDLNKLDRKLPVNLYQPGCLNTLYDPECGLNKANWAFADAAAVGSTASVILCGLAQAAYYFDQGQILFTLGANTGQNRTIKAYAPGRITVIEPFLSVPAAGDGFYAYPGCAKDMGTCGAKFNNYVTVEGHAVLRFRGQPFIPDPKTVL